MSAEEFRLYWLAREYPRDVWDPLNCKASRVTFVDLLVGEPENDNGDEPVYAEAAE
jgi:hypothetical protein